MLFDALICNKDRHLGNFGMMIDNNTNKILNPAPIFDNGLSMINSLTKDELNKIDEVMSKQTSFFNLTFDEQLKLFSKPRHLESLQKLSKFEFKKHQEFNIEDSFLYPIQNVIQYRANKAKELLKSLNLDKTKQNTKIKQKSKSRGYER